MFTRWLSIPRRYRKLAVAFFLLIWIGGALLPSGESSYLVVAHGIDATGRLWSASGHSEATRFYGFVGWQSTAVQWVPTPYTSPAQAPPPAPLALPLLPLGADGRPDPAPAARFIQPYHDTPYATADLEEEAVRAAITAAALTASASRPAVPGTLARIVFPLLAASLVAGSLLLAGKAHRSNILCVACDYPLVNRRDGQPGKHCPECGALYPP